MQTHVSSVTMLSMSVAAIALTGCMHHLMAKSPSTQSCDASRLCDIQVDAVVSGGRCMLTPPDMIEVWLTDPPKAVHMRWTLNAPHSEFKFKRRPGSHNGITILDNPDDPQFSDESDSDDKQASKKDKATALGTFPYKIVAQFRSGPHGGWTDCPFDPVIVNRN